MFADTFKRSGRECYFRLTSHLSHASFRSAATQEESGYECVCIHCVNLEDALHAEVGDSEIPSTFVNSCDVHSRDISSGPTSSPHSRLSQSSGSGRVFAAAT